MDDEERKDEQNQSENTVFDDVFNTIQEHPKETGIGAAIAVAVLIYTNIQQWRKRKIEEKRHCELERLAQEAIQKQDAELKDLSQKAKDAEYLGTVNEALVKALESEKNKGGKSDEQE